MGDFDVPLEARLERGGDGSSSPESSISFLMGDFDVPLEARLERGGDGSSSPESSSSSVSCLTDMSSSDSDSSDSISSTTAMTVQIIPLNLERISLEMLGRLLTYFTSNLVVTLGAYFENSFTYLAREASRQRHGERV